VIERRLIEKYAGVFHTVDHVEGILQDASIRSMPSSVTCGGDVDRCAQEGRGAGHRGHREGARGWYGGAVGMILLNGDINTGILIRTTYLRDGMASYPVGATLLYDSVPAMEERETRLKATRFFPHPGSARSGSAAGRGEAQRCRQKVPGFCCG